MKKWLFPLLLTVTTAHAGMSITYSWNKEALKVCFGNKNTEVRLKGLKNKFSNWKESDKAAIRQILLEEYTPEVTGYHFYGFDDCETSEKPDIVVVKMSSFSTQALEKNGIANVGPGFVYPVPEIKSAKGIVALSARGIQRSTVSHEFGHVLGLLHEQDHPDAYKKAEDHCRYYSKEEKERKNFHIYSDFDEVSVMNYCRIHKLDGANVGLSDGDINHIRMLYKDSTIRNKREF